MKAFDSLADILIPMLSLFITFGSGWLFFVLKEIQARIESLRTTDNSLIVKVNAIEVLVSGSYITRQEFKADMKSQTDHFNSRFDRIESSMK